MTLGEHVPYLVEIAPQLLAGVRVTLALTSWALTMGVSLGLPMALARVYGRGLLKWSAMLYTEALRGTPLLVQLFIIYYGLPDIIAGLRLDRFTAAALALGLNSAAYQAEYFRGAISGIGEGQLQAALSLGMTRLQAIVHIIMPQAFRLALPALSNEVAYMLKYTSVVFVIAVPDLMSRGKMIIGWSYRAEETLLAVALLYIVLVNGAARLMADLERKFRIPGLQADRAV